MYSLHNVLENR